MKIVTNRYLKKIVRLGTRQGDIPSSTRGIILSNSIALILTVCVLAMFGTSEEYNTRNVVEALIALVVFSAPLLLNYLRLTLLGKLFLCFAPSMVIFGIMVLAMQDESRIQSSTYFGLRLYLLAFGCIPYLLLDRKPLIIFLMGVMPSLVALLFLDFWLDLAGVGYALRGIPDNAYELAPRRTLFAYAMVSGCCLTLRYIVDSIDRKNQQLIDRLKESNDIIKRQAETDLIQLNQKLIENLAEISKREFILKQSQKIAKVGSWELNMQDKTMFWSDEMYDIFGIDQSANIKDKNLLNFLMGDNAKIIELVHQDVLEKQKPYDLTMKTKTPIGYVKWVRLAGFPMIVNGKTVGITGIVHDVTVFKESEERIRANEKNYRTVFEQANDAIMIIDFAGNFLDANSRACKMVGRPKEQLLIMNFSQIMEPENLKVVPIKLDQLVLGELVTSEHNILAHDGRVLQVEVTKKIFSERRIMVIARDITSRKQAEREKEKISHDLNERVKELTTLYKASQILQVDTRPMHEALQDVVDIIPSGWQYSRIAAARISLAGLEFVTANYGLAKHSLVSHFTTLNGLHGTIEAIYLEERPTEIEGPFVAEERDLINMLANMIQTFLNRRYEAEALKRSEANQRATINNTNFHIWSVNREYELISFNKISSEFLKERLGVAPQVGKQLTDGLGHLTDMHERWVSRYNRALAGETFKILLDVFERKFEYSLNPIIEAGKIIGVTVFGEDITDRLIREKEIQDANKLIGELQLMALRSVMNPHFIFNSLNSIQYYIMENDARSAVTYLSTFSKLIRAILSNSVKSKVRLADELDMIKNYIQMEAMRFENKFQSVIHVDATVDVENTEIPSMLVQPYVENSILHGLYNKKGPGTLKISVSQVNETLLFEIEDDGIGRNAAEALKLQAPPHHKSMGTALTEERLRLINRNGDATVKITDLEVDGKPAGTKVSIWVNQV